MSNASVMPDRGHMLTLERAPGAPGFDLLTAREREVVKRAILGSHNKAIAYDLGLSDSTIRVFMCRAASKLGVRSRRELLAKMTDLSAAPPPEPSEQPTTTCAIRDTDLDLPLLAP